MSLSKAHLTNLAVFMERVQVTGKEALAWAQTYEAVQAELRMLDSPPSASVKEKTE